MMRRASSDEPILPRSRQLRLLLQCREAKEVGLCEHIAFAFARDAGLRGIDVWYVARCATALADFAVARGGGELELRVVDAPRPALELQLRDRGGEIDAPPPTLLAARELMSEICLRSTATRTIVTARKWLRGNS
jgi:hypothetical protein